EWRRDPERARRPRRRPRRRSRPARARLRAAGTSLAARPARRRPALPGRPAHGGVVDRSRRFRCGRGAQRPRRRRRRALPQRREALHARAAVEPAPLGRAAGRRRRRGARRRPREGREGLLMQVDFVTPVAALVGFAAVVPLAAWAFAERRVARVRTGLRLRPPRGRGWWAPVAVA